MSEFDSSKVISRQISKEGITEYHVVGVDTWEYFDSLVCFFMKHYSAEVCSQQDGIYTREWSLKVNSETFIICHHEDVGNYFYSSLNAGKTELMELFTQDLTQRLKNTNYE